MRKMYPQCTTPALKLTGFLFLNRSIDLGAERLPEALQAFAQPRRVQRATTLPRRSQRERNAFCTKAISKKEISSTLLSDGVYPDKLNPGESVMDSQTPHSA